MIINNGELELTPNNSYIVSYPNDILDGVYIDNDDNYAFISAHMEGYPELLDALDDECVGSVTFERIQPSEEPTCYIIEAIGKLMVKELEDMLEDEPTT